jgi:LAO/AO transport system kinase
MDDFWAAVTPLPRPADRQRPTGRTPHAQDQAWMWERIEAGLRERFKSHPAVREALPRTTDDVRAGRWRPRWPRGACST